MVSSLADPRSAGHNLPLPTFRSTEARTARRQCIRRAAHTALRVTFRVTAAWTEDGRTRVSLAVSAWETKDEQSWPAKVNLNPCRGKRTSERSGALREENVNS